MRRHRFFVPLVLSAVAIAVCVIAASTGSEAAAPDRSAKKVQIICTPGWGGSAVGQYGGVGFGVSCTNGRGTQIIDGVVGTAYSTRMGVETEGQAADCAFSGDDAIVDVTCVQVRLTIQ